MSAEDSFKERFRNARKQRRNVAPKRKLKSDGNNESIQTLSQSEVDRILMPPPPSRAQKKQKQVDSVETPSEDTPNGVPDDFFEYDRKKKDVETRKSFIQQHTEDEYVRYKQEVDESLEQLAQEAAEDELQTQENLNAVEEHEQHERLELIAQLKLRRSQQDSKKLQTQDEDLTPDPNTEEESSEDSEEEVDWRSRGR